MKDRIVFQATYKDNSMDAQQRKDFKYVIAKAGKIRILKAGRHASGDEMYVIEFTNVPVK